MPGERRSRSRRSQTVLPLQSQGRLSNSISCWYCDLKITALNGFIYTLGRKRARHLRIWFTIGITASFVALAVTTVFLLQQLTCTVQLLCGRSHFYHIPSNWLIAVSDLRLLSLMDVGIMIFSTLISVLVHEFGHAIAAASQGIQMEYLALFLSVMFPGALVAINYNLLQALPSLSALRIYCAGIWHNFVLSVVCGLALLSLPGVLYPFYMHGERPMVLSLSSGSPLVGYLSPGDIIMSLNGRYIHNPDDWAEKTKHLVPRLHNYSSYPDESMSMKGYCIPNSWMKDEKILSTYDENVCPEDLVPFIEKGLDANHFHDGYDISTRKYYCFPPQDVVKLKKCGDACQIDRSNQICQCLEDQGCFVPIQSLHAIWAEVSVSRPYLSECLKFKPNETLMGLESFHSMSTPCVETFVFVGDVSIANSFKLTAYQPRWTFGYFGMHLPSFLEKIFLSMLRVSASLGLLNCMPVFFLDGESIMEVSVSYITCIDNRSRQRLFRLILAGGTALFAVALARMFLSVYLGNI